ncbi:MAG: trigger factor [Planctomycetota bacterium]
MSDGASLADHVTISDAGPSLKKLSFDIPADAVDTQVRESFDAIADQVALPGFRAGRAPRGLIEKKFGSNVRDEARQKIVSEAYREAVEKHELRVVGDPVSEQLAGLEVEEGKGLAFDIEVEVLPEFELPATEGLEIKKPTMSVADEMVDAELDKICLNEGELEEREAPEAGDYISGHGVMRASGHDEPVHDIEGAVVQAPETDSGMILGVMVSDLKKQLGLPKPGESVTISAKGPDQHEVEAVRGADLEITWEVTRVDRVVRAEASAIAERGGFEDVDALKHRIRQQLEQRVVVEQQMAMRSQVARHLQEGTDFELPERLTARQAGRSLERQRMELMYRGVDANEIEEKLAELRTASDSSARRELKQFFVLAKVAEKLDVRVTEAEVNQRVYQLAAQNGVRPEQMRDHLMKNNQINQIAQQVLEHKALDAVIAKSTVEEVDEDAWKKLVEGWSKDD